MGKGRESAWQKVKVGNTSKGSARHPHGREDGFLLCRRLRGAGRWRVRLWKTPLHLPLPSFPPTPTLLPRLLSPGWGNPPGLGPAPPPRRPALLRRSPPPPTRLCSADSRLLGVGRRLGAARGSGATRSCCRCGYVGSARGILPAGAEQNSMGGAAAAAGPTPGGLRRLRLGLGGLRPGARTRPPCSSAYDARLRQKVAVKKLSRPFQSLIHARRTYRELRLLKHLKHENVIGLLDVFTPATSIEDFSEVYLVTTLMGADLNNIVKCQALSDEHVQFLVYQLLRGLKYIHSAGIIHRDLKPSNVAVNEDCELRILDFGLARQADEEMTGYVATRWYRAPEIMLNWMHYNQTVDIWSVGCIMAELLQGKALFPGNDYIDQLKRIMEVVGTPSPEVLAKISSEHARTYIQSLPPMPQKDLSSVFHGANPLAVDLLGRMLVLDSDQRVSAAEALAHAYFSQYHDPDDEPEAEPYDESVEAKERTLEEWKELTYQEVLSFKPLEPSQLPGTHEIEQ